MRKFNTIANLGDDRLLQAYEELKLDKLPQASNSIIRNIQIELYREIGNTVPLFNVKYYIAMEMLNRFYKEVE